MSVPSLEEAKEAFYEDYQNWCADNKIPATYDGFGVWLSESDLDEPDMEDRNDDSARFEGQSKEDL